MPLLKIKPFNILLKCVIVSNEKWKSLKQTAYFNEISDNLSELIRDNKETSVCDEFSSQHILNTDLVL
jgi:hypothetical protein